MRVAPHALAAALGLTLACAEPAPPPPPPDAGLVFRDDLHLRWQAGLPRLPVTATVPPAYLEAARTWRTATTSFSIGAYDDASRDFMAAAETLTLTGQPSAITQVARAGRCMAYENAAVAYRGATQPEDGIVALAKARARDPECRHSITRVLDRLSSRTGTTAPDAPPVAPEATTATRAR